MPTFTTVHTCHCLDPLHHFLNFIYLLIIVAVLAALRLSLVVVSGDYTSLWCAGFSLQWPLLLQVAASRHVGFSSRGTQTKSSCGTWDLPRPGMEPMSPASVGRFLTTGPPGNSPLHQFCSRTGLPGFQWASLGETRR